MRTDLDLICLQADSTIRQALRQMEANHSGIVLVVDPKGRLLGTLTDGDMRRAMLANLDFDQPITVIMARKAKSLHAHPITARANGNPDLYLSRLKKHHISHLPLVDANRRVVGLVTLDDFFPNKVLPLFTVVMAGGEGNRLRPLTDDLPKPMLPLGDKPLMEITIQRLKDAGIRHVNVSTHYKSEKIGEHFNDGRDIGVKITYLTEDRPLGTAGALGLLNPPDETTLVINGDILTQIDFRAMLAYHREQSADITVAIRRFALQIPYGVVECDQSRIVQLTEKPALEVFINAGIYLLEPSVYRSIPKNRRFEMTELIQSLVDAGQVVAGFPIHEQWLDIGEKEDYMKARELVESGEPHP